MDDELRAFLEDRFGRLDRRMDAFDHRMDALEQRVGGLEQRIGSLDGRLARVESELAALRSQTSHLGVVVESVQDQVRLVAEGHSVLYGAIDRQYEEVRAEMRDVRALLRVWNDLVTRRLSDLEYRVREKAG